MHKLPWFRMYSEARMDLKLATLSDSEFRTWFRLLCLAAEQDERGTIPPMTQYKLTVECGGGDLALLQSTLQKLVSLDIITLQDNEITFIHFGERQYDSPSQLPSAVGNRVRKHREMKRLVTSCNDDVTTSNAEEESRGEENRVEEKKAPTVLKKSASAAPPLSQEQRDKLVSDYGRYWPAGQIYDRIEEALNHKASEKAKDKYLFVRGWLRRDAEKAAPLVAMDRNTDKYKVWPGGRKQG